MSKIENTSKKSPFLPENKTKDIREKSANFIRENYSGLKTKDANLSDANVSIPETTKLYSQIRKVADASSEPDKSEKIDTLKKKIDNGEYNIDDDKLAELITRNEFQIWSE